MSNFQVEGCQEFAKSVSRWCQEPEGVEKIIMMSRMCQEGVKGQSRGWQQGVKNMSGGCQLEVGVKRVSRGWQQGAERASKNKTAHLPAT